VRVALIGFSPYSWSPPVTDIPAAQTLVREAAAQADVVVVVMHAGAEGQDRSRTPAGAEAQYKEDRGSPRAFAHAAVDAGADLVLGSGPHVLRGIERYRGRLIAYSLGDFAGWNTFSTAGLSALSGMLTVRVDGTGRVLGGQLLSLKLVEPDVPEPDQSGEAVALVKRLSAQDFKQTFQMDAEGVIRP
jgi:hypothetical protein